MGGFLHGPLYYIMEKENELSLGGVELEPKGGPVGASERASERLGCEKGSCEGPRVPSYRDRTRRAKEMI